MTTPATRAFRALLLVLVMTLAGCTATVPPPTPVPHRDPGVVWRTEVTANGQALVGDAVVAVWQEGVTVLDAGTGDTRWDYRPPEGFAIAGWGATSHVVALVMNDWSTVTKPESEVRSRTIGLVMATGRQSWADQAAELHPLPRYLQYGGPPVQFATHGDTLVVPWQNTGSPWYGLAGVDAPSGTVTWTTNFEGIDGLHDCALVDNENSLLPPGPLLAATGQLAAVAARCAEGFALLAVDPATGHTRWATPLSGGEPQRLLADSGTVLVGQAGRDTMLDAGGRMLFEGELPPERLVLAVAAGVAVVAGRNGAADPLVAIDLRTGRTRWTHDRPGPDLPDVARFGTYDGLTASNGVVLGYRSAAMDSQPLGVDPTTYPAVVDRIDPLTGTVEPVVAPVAGAGDWITVAGDKLLLDEGRGLVALHLTSDRTPPAAYAAAAPDRWPDACALLTTGRLRTLWPGTDLTPTGQSASLLGSPLPKPVVCDFTDLYGDAVATVAVRWVADAPAGATVIADVAYTASAGMNLYTDDKPEPLLPNVGTWAFGDAATRVTLRAGRAIVAVRAWDVAVPAVAVAQSVTEELHTLGYR